MKRSKLVGVTGAFLALMILFTVLSRAADSAGLANVTLGRPQNMMIAHEVRGTGRVEQNQEQAVIMESGQRVGAVYVNEGQQVEKGELLFELDLDSLRENILKQKQEIRKLELQLRDAASQESVSEKRRANEQAQAAESYSLSASRASVSLSHARENLEKAKKELKEYREKEGVSGEDTIAEQELEQVCEECSAAYVQAQQDLQTLQWRIEKAVDDALRQASQGSVSGKLTENVLWRGKQEDASEGEPEGEANRILSDSPAEKVPNTQIKTGSAGTSENSEASDPGKGEEAAAGQTELSGTAKRDSTEEILTEDFGAAILESAVLPVQGKMAETDEEDADIQIDNIIIEEIEPDNDFQDSLPGENTGSGNDETGDSLPGDSTGSGKSEEKGHTVTGNGMKQNGGGIPGTEDDAEPGNDTGPENSQTGNSAMSPPTWQELDQIEQAVRSQYAADLEAAEQAVADALAEKQKAEAALEDCRQKMFAASGSQSAEQEQQLIDAVKAAQMAYEDAAIAANEAAVTGKRQVKTAGLPEVENSTGDIYEIDLAQKKRGLSKLKKLKKAKGKIKAPVDGIVTGVYVTTGEQTPDGTAVMLADMTKGCRLTAEIPQEQEKYIGRGDLVTVKSGDGKVTLEEIPVESIAAKAEDESVRLVTVQIPENKLQPGTTAELSLTKKSAAYPLCIPLAALYLDEKNQTYVLAAQEINSVLGTEMQAFRVAVTVEDRNDSYAALAQGSINSSQNIIVSSDRPVSEGSRVRVVS